MKKYYFENKDSEICYPKEYFIDKMKDEKLKEIEVFEAEKYKEVGIFWCKKYYTVGEKEKGYEGCGNYCRGYEPKNGKSGCCKHYSRTLFTLGKKITLKIKL
jgi:hypothetical protein